MNWNEIKRLKESYLEAENKARSAKTRKTVTKYQDLAHSIRRELSQELSEWNFDGLDFTQLNIMAPVGGPLHVMDAENFKVEKNLGSCLQISFELEGHRYAAYVHWVDNKCGIDNIAKIA